MTNQQTTEEILKSLLTKTDTLNLKIMKMETNTDTIKTEIADISIETLRASKSNINRNSKN